MSEWYEPIMRNEWPADFPNKDKFNGSDLEFQSPRWEYHRDPGEGGDNVAQDFHVPEGRVLVGWSAEETSCIRCGGGDYNLIMKRVGTRSFPVGARTGSRLEPGGIGGPGASFTGNLSLISVPYDVWVRVTFIADLSYTFSLA